MKKIIEFFKRLFGGKTQVSTPVATPKPQQKSNGRPQKPKGTGVPKSVEVKEGIELSESPKPKKKRYYNNKPKQGGSSGNGRQPYNTK